MDNRIQTWLYDILNSIQEIDTFFLKIKAKYFQNNKKILKQSVLLKEILK